MKLRNLLKTIVWVSSVVAILLVGFSYGALVIYSRTPAFKQFAEAQAGELLKANVEIGRIDVGFAGRIVLSDIRIRSESSQAASYRVRVDGLIFRYNLLQLLQRDWRMPANIILKAPRLSFEDFSFPYDFFDDVRAGQAGAVMVGIKLDNGEASFFIPALKAHLMVRKITGTVKPLAGGNFRLHLDAVLEEAVTGRLRISGEVNPSNRTHQLKLTLDDVDAGEILPIPLKDFKGDLLWTNDRLRFRNLSAKWHGWQTDLSGEWIRTGYEPSVELFFRVGKNKPVFDFQVKADFLTQEMTGGITFLTSSHSFRGRIVRAGAVFESPKFIFDESYKGNLRFDGALGRLSLEAGKDRERIAADLNLKNLNMHLRLKGDHVKLFGLDVVGSTKIRLVPMDLSEKSFQWKFSGDFESEYFIVQYLPLDDFRGHFELGASGIRNLSAFWGDVFRLEADLSFRRRKDRLRAVIHVNGFDFRNLKEWASKPLRRDLGGILDGKLKIQGDLPKPEIFGNFRVKDGWVGRLNYDRGIVRFQGIPPYVPLQDSRVVRGRTTLYLTGALNFSMLNFFKGVELQTADKIVLWRGWELNASPDEGDLEFAYRGLGLPVFSVKTGGGVVDGTPEEQAGLHGEEQYVMVGPKLKF